MIFAPGTGGGANHYVLAATVMTGGDADIHIWWIEESGQVSRTRWISVAGPGEQSFPALTYNAESQKVILAWQDKGFSPVQIRRRLFDGTGEVVGEDISLSFAPPTHGSLIPKAV